MNAAAHTRSRCGLTSAAPRAVPPSPVTDAQRAVRASLAARTHVVFLSAIVCAIVALTCCPSHAGLWRWTWPSPPGDSPPRDPLLQSPPQAQPQTPHPAVVRVTAQESDGLAQGSGTLVDVRDQLALVVTNWHVVRDATGPIHVVFPDGFQSAARVLQVDRDWDLAALLIWRPRVAAVPLASAAPRPGDHLTIAGYGPGSYRAVPGRCTQYVAPSTRHPYEMVEVSTMAREGDSGGPIFNDRGELAGVLFGSGGGTTAGSYAGRVREFLKTAWTPPESTLAPPAFAVSSDPTANPPAADWTRANASLVPTEPIERLPAVSAESDDDQLAQLTPLPSRTTRLDPPVSDLAITLAPPTDARVPSGETTQITWQQFAGDTIYQQAKTVLAIIGLAALFMQLTRRKT